MTLDVLLFQPFSSLLLDAPPEGVILFSLGFTGFQSKDIPTEVMENFVRVLGELKQTVIMRYKPGSDWTLRTPENVVMVEWMPQQEILGEVFKN